MELFTSLPGTADRRVLLCTDLHAGNVLASGRRHSTGGAATAPRCLSRKPSTDATAVATAKPSPMATDGEMRSG